MIFLKKCQSQAYRAGLRPRHPGREPPHQAVRRNPQGDEGREQRFRQDPRDDACDEGAGKTINRLKPCNLQKNKAPKIHSGALFMSSWTGPYSLVNLKSLPELNAITMTPRRYFFFNTQISEKTFCIFAVWHSDWLFLLVIPQKY